MVEHSDQAPIDPASISPSPTGEPFEFDADRHLAELELLHCMVRRSHPLGASELYRRTSSMLRLRCLDGASGQDSIQVGSDEGLALRIVTGDGRAVFGATSGAGDADLQWLVDRSRSTCSSPLPDDEPWDLGEPFRIDRERTLRLPSPAEVRTWLTDAAQRLGPHAEAWVEVAATLESWVAGEGLRASRSRQRAWAYARPAPFEPGSAQPAPLVVASRRWEDLPRDGWARLAADRVHPRGPAATRLPNRCAVLFSPESAAGLVHALVRTLHGHGAAAGSGVGPGWRLADDPTAASALFGGAFDDVRFPTVRRELADGRHITGSTADRGCYRRPSYRDAPATMPANIVVEAGPEALPRHGVLVSSLRVHPLGPERWVLAFDGAVLEQGAPGSRIQGGWISVAPLDLVQRCVGTYGEAMEFRQGVRTPALLFDDLFPAAG